MVTNEARNTRNNTHTHSQQSPPRTSALYPRERLKHPSNPNLNQRYFLLILINYLITVAGGGRSGGMVNLTPLDLRRFHRLERDFYKKLVHQLHLNRDRVKWVLSLWLWLESIGHHDFIRRVSAHSDHRLVLLFLDEGNACLDRLTGHRHPERGEDLPLTSTLVVEPMDLGFFDFHRDIAIARVTHFHHRVANIIFDDDDDDDDDVAARLSVQGHLPFGEGTSQQGAAVHVPRTNAGTSQQGHAASSSRLNPMAEPWSPAMNLSPEEQRSMFITFSRGHPISRDEIMDFFNARYGKCVELVMIERATRGSPPMYGRVVFTSASMIAIVLNGQQTAKFMIKGKHLWARIYVPRQHLP